MREFHPPPKATRQNYHTRYSRTRKPLARRNFDALLKPSHGRRYTYPSRGRQKTGRTAWPELVSAHERWVESYNGQSHFVHRERPDDRRSPREVLGWLTEVRHHLGDLERPFFSVRFSRVLDPLGYATFRRWRLTARMGWPAGRRPCGCTKRASPSNTGASPCLALRWRPLRVADASPASCGCSGGRGSLRPPTRYRGSGSLGWTLWAKPGGSRR